METEATGASSTSDLNAIYQPFKVGPRTLRCRVYVPAHQPALADNGVPGPRYVAYHRRLAKAGVGMQITGATPILPSGLWRPDRSLLNVDETIVPGYQRLSDAVHANGGLMLAQLAHAGPTDEGVDDVIGPSWGLSELSGEVSRPATESDIQRIVAAYGAAADRCRRGGLDGVEVTMAHGLLLAAFLSPKANRRTDQFGGAPDTRAELPLRALAEVRRALGPDRIVGVRLCADEMIPGGVNPQDAAVIARRLADTGQIDYISVIAGDNTHRLPRIKHWPPTPAPHGLFRSLSRVVKDAVPDLPVCCVGRVTSVALAAEIIASGDADLVGMVRAHIADPELLPKSRAGRIAEVTPCVGANDCINLSLNHQSVSCIVNPQITQPTDTELVPGEHSAVVIGAGPAGLESARRLASIGLRTTLFERSGELGGLLRLWAQVPAYREYSRLLGWWQNELNRLGVVVQTNTDVGGSEGLNADVFIVATGGRQHDETAITTDGSVQTASPDEVLRGRRIPGRVVVYDELGRRDSIMLAEALIDSGSAQVTIVTSKVHIGEGEGITTLYPALERLDNLGVSPGISSGEGRGVRGVS
ncbi:NAD-binding protein [Leekyejoonella antrihumi]|uniref:NADH:flavin oxidoreductase/NADH oxidase N-terminal domain-containing protein n=1 Tax=Leekyejoonella antrihumi TaxID=1660198 RepID=A0A563DSN7_9MICO|nr:NAD-binding protein [Leekyejoonella antrihumi]TWP33257.1 hypothetical protein FGL98_21920 [Leekyejoonella antrihumi]